MRRLALSLWGTFLLSGCQLGPSGAAPPILPLRSLRLYETGVGYFERAGQVKSGEGDAAVLPIPAGHLDDALKTLVVLGKDGKAQVHGVEFGSSMSKGMARALAGLPTGDEAIQYRDLISSLKGAAVELRTQHERLTGRVIEVVDAPAEEPGAAPAAEAGKKPAPATPSVLTVLLLTDRGEIRRFPAHKVLSVRPVDAGSATRLGSALTALSTHGAQTRRLLRLLAKSDGPVTLGYIAETPIWRTTYRLVYKDDDKGGGVLQGWALLHNDADEDWREVRVHLVNGKPDSFLYPLAAPRYERRELVHPENQLSTVPQLLDTTVDAIWGDNTEGLGLTGYGAGGGGSGSGTIGMGRIGTVGHGSGVGTSSGTSGSALLNVGNLAGIEAATGVEAGALFTYSLAAPLSLRAHGSALVPFLQEPVKIERLTVFDSPGGTGRTTARLSNSTRQTLPEGPIAFFSDGGFAGEAVLDRLKPGERRFIPYGTDMDVDISIKKTVPPRDETRHLVFEDKRQVLTEHFLRHGDITYAIENRSGGGRQVALVLGLSNNAEVHGADRVDYNAEAQKALAVFQVAPLGRVERRVTTVEGLSRRHGLAEFTATRLAELAALSVLPGPARAALTQATARQHEVEATLGEISRLKGEQGKLEEELKRWREDLRALGGDKDKGATAQNPFVGRILETEDRLGAGRKRLGALEEQLAARRKTVAAALVGLREPG